MATRICEKQLSDIWRRQSFCGALLTEGGEKVEIVYPGRMNDGRGGDFCDAVIAFPERTLAGNVELHVRSGDWRSHGHDRDASYNRVILHVVYANNTGCPTTLESGRHVPVLALERYAGRRGAKFGGRNEGRGRPCRGVLRRLGKKAVTAALERAGDDRFARKEKGFSEELGGMEAGQVLYQGVMTALGYSRNKAPFLELSRRLPLAVLEAVGRESGPDEAFRRRVEACLLKVAGLRATDPDGSPGGDDGFHLSGTLPMSASEWEMLRARPNNSPRTRIKAMSHLLARYRDGGLLRGLLGAIREAPEERAYVSVEAALAVGSDPSGAYGAQGEHVSILGGERAADIAVNVLLPFTSAFGRASGEPGLGKKALLLYRCWPRLGANCLERHMTAQMGLTPQVVNSARRQQGLIEIYSDTCTKGKCGVCVLGQP